jgi:glucose-1-phosphate cytidylyltransferase
MKTIILAGGLGTRLSEETDRRPKPMVEIGEFPILEHIMRIYSAHGFREFVVALGYKAEVVKDYFLNYFARGSDLTVDLSNGNVKVHDGHQVPWKVHLVDTGMNSQTGGRVWRLRDWVSDATFMMTYGDGVSDVPIRDLVDFHKSHGKVATVTAVRPPSRFGGLVFDENRVTEFSEKPQTGEGWINGGFFVFEPEIFNYLSGEGDILERAPLERVVADGQLMAYKHEGFWQAMDTLREKRMLEAMWESGQAPWKVWK